MYGKDMWHAEVPQRLLRSRRGRCSPAEMYGKDMVGVPLRLHTQLLSRPNRHPRCRGCSHVLPTWHVHHMSMMPTI